MLQLTHSKTGKSLEVDEFWLRDHCRCGECLNTETNQRRYDLVDLPVDVHVMKHNWQTPEQLVVECKYLWSQSDALLMLVYTPIRERWASFDLRLGIHL